MKIQIEVEIQPFSIPNFVRRKRFEEETVGEKDESTGIPLRELDADTLLRLCDEFTVNVFNKAGKQVPPRPV